MMSLASSRAVPACSSGVRRLEAAPGRVPVSRISAVGRFARHDRRSSSAAASVSGRLSATGRRARRAPRAISDVSETHPDEDHSPNARGRASETASSASGRTPPSETVRVDFLVIGSGISGLSYALEAARHGTVAIVTKDVAYEGSTHYAQGGISAVIAEDDEVDAHVKDTHVAGDWLCDPAAVETVCRGGRAAVQKLVAFGVAFTRDERGDLHLAREGGHSEKRIVHADDMTGKEIERALLESARARENVTFYEFHAARDLVTATTVACDGEGNIVPSCDEITRCVGAETTRRADGARLTFLAPCTLLAAGGAGQLFPSTTNPSVSTGDGVAMAVRAGARVANMEFVQFHPTALYTGPGGARRRSATENAFLVTEAVRGHGGRLFDAPVGGTRFMERYDDRLELAPRDVVARAIDREIKAAIEVGKEEACVWLDVTHLDAEATTRAFPGIAAELRARGVDMTAQRIPVTPAAHYLCGGVVTDLHGATSVEGLFAVGECAYTGVHGANRLASNSLLEAAVFADRAALASKRRLDEFGESLRPTLDAVQACVERGEAERAAAGRVARVDAIDPSEDARRATPHEDEDEDEEVCSGDATTRAPFDADETWSRAARKATQRVMWRAAGIVRERSALLSAQTELESMLRQCEAEMRARHGGGLRAHETRNLIVCGLCVLRSALSREESRGLHYVLDFPEKVEAERKPTLVELGATEVYGRAPVVSVIAAVDALEETAFRATRAPAR